MEKKQNVDVGPVCSLLIKDELVDVFTTKLHAGKSRAGWVIFGVVPTHYEALQPQMQNSLIPALNRKYCWKRIQSIL